MTKLVMVGLLIAFHASCAFVIRDFRNGRNRRTMFTTTGTMKSPHYFGSYSPPGRRQTLLITGERAVVPESGSILI
jgi:hypothetical protein